MIVVNLPQSATCFGPRTVLSPLVAQNGAIAADLDCTVKFLILDSSIELSFDFCGSNFFLEKTTLQEGTRRKQPCKKEQGFKKEQHGKNEEDGKMKRSPRNQERDHTRSTRRRHMYNRKKTLESMGLIEEDFCVEFSYKQDAPSRSPSPGRDSKGGNLSQKPVSQPAAAVAAQIQVAKPSQRAAVPQHILLKALP